jgi:L-seryl-tRNA(Ser) seleniumtransferase
MAETGDPRPAEGLRPVINVSGTMTSLGASIVVPEAIRAVADFLPHFVEMPDLQRKASAAIARATGAEAGVVTASASAGVSQTVAALMTGTDLAAAERLPDVSGLARDEVVLQLGHLVNYGAPIDQSVRLTGAKLKLAGTATETAEYQLAGALGDRTVAGLYVVSHHVVNYGQLPLPAFARICHARGIPVLVDAASEYDLRGFLAAGADVAIYSGHKFLGGPTSGIVAGPKNMIRSVYLQSFAIGRGMKVGKEGVIGVIAALRAWAGRDHGAIRARENACLEFWLDRLSRLAGITPIVSPDPTHNPLSRLRLVIDPEKARITAWDLADRLAAGDPPVIVRDHEAELGYFFLDPCNLHPGEERLAAERIEEECARALAESEPVRTSLEARNRRRVEKMLRWPD